MLAQISMKPEDKVLLVVILVFGAGPILMGFFVMLMQAFGVR